MPLVLVAKGFPSCSRCGFAALTFIGYPVGSLLSLPLVERVERKILLVVSGLGMAVFGLLFGLSDAPGAIVIFGFLYTVISNVFSNAFHVYQAEIFPTRLRATASGSTYALSRLSNALLPFILLPVLAAFGPVAMFAVVSAAMVVVALDIGLLGPRSTGRDLEAVNEAGCAAISRPAARRGFTPARGGGRPGGLDAAGAVGLVERVRAPCAIWASTERYLRPARRSASLRSRMIERERVERARVEEARRVDQLHAERAGHPELQLQQVARRGPADGVVEEQHARVRPSAVPALVGPQRRHRAVQDDRRGEPLAAGEHVADLRDPQPFGAQHGVGLEHLDAHALRHRRPHAREQQRHAVAAARALARDLLLRRAVDDLAQRVPQHRLVEVVEADAQELLAGPVGEAVGQLGEPLGEPQRAQRLPDHAAQAGHDPGVVTADAREVVLQRTQPRTQCGRPVRRQRGHVGARHTADVLAHGAGQRAEPGLLRELGHGVDGARGPRARRGPARPRRPSARRGRPRWPRPRRRRPRRTARVPSAARSAAGAVQAADDVPEALRGRGDGVAFAHGVARDPGGGRGGVLGDAAVLLGALDPLLAVRRVGRRAVGGHRTRVAR